MDSARFKSLVIPCHRRMFAIAVSVTGNTDDAADAVQETMMRLWEKRDSLDRLDNIDAYAATCVRNTALRIMSRRRFDIRHDGDNGPDTPATPDLEAEIATRDRARRVLDIIGTLPDNQRRVVTMRDIDGLALDEIESATGLTAVNVRVLLSRARTAIRKHFSTR